MIDQRLFVVRHERDEIGEDGCQSQDQHNRASDYSGTVA